MYRRKSEFWWSQNFSGGKRDPASEEDIREAEKTLGLRFSPDYRTFLAMFGYLQFCYTYSHEIYGIVHDERFKRAAGTVHWTLKIRELSELPHQYIVIWSDEGDEFWCIDTSVPDEPVIAWDFFERCVARKMADSFIDLLYHYAANERRVIRDKDGRLLDEENTQYEEVREIVWCCGPAPKNDSPASKDSPNSGDSSSSEEKYRKYLEIIEDLRDIQKRPSSYILGDLSFLMTVNFLTGYFWGRVNIGNFREWLVLKTGYDYNNGWWT
ncbi:MAG: SMI1/KNR4 family protein [Planctomycetia bacterium]|nr:SMI1/KNR4 family protein [Planctomycetia bacterium]